MSELANNKSIRKEVDDLGETLGIKPKGKNNQQKIRSIGEQASDGTYATKEYVNTLMSGALKRSIVETLPTENIDTNTIYMVLDESASQQGNVYNEYLYINNAWELIGTTATSVTILEVSNIKGLTTEQCEALNVGDVVVKLTSNQKHTYTVSYKEVGVGMCLTYSDATYLETISYDYVDGNWVYNSQDSTVVASKSYVDSLMSGALKRAVVETLPVSDIDTNTIYMVLDTEASSGNVYNEYMYINDTWELIGTTAVGGDVLLSDIVDSHGNKRFVEGTCSLNTINGITWQYNKWSLSGTHLMIVICGYITSNSLTISSNSFGSITLPDYILNKISATSNNKVSVKTFDITTASFTVTDTIMVSLSKFATLGLYWGEAKTITAQYNDFRIQFDLLIDAE